MPNSANNHSVKNSFKRGFKSNAEKISANCRTELKLNDFDPLPAFLLAEHLKLEILTPDQIPGLGSLHLAQLMQPPGSEHWSAITIGNDKPCHIIYNNSHSSSRTQSNIMHELAHVLLGHTMGEIDTSMGMPLRKYDQDQENEAEWLGGCLQLPKPALIKYFVFKKYTPEQIAEAFNASLAMVRYRIGVSGVQVLKTRLKR